MTDDTLGSNNRTAGPPSSRAARPAQARAGDDAPPEPTLSSVPEEGLHILVTAHGTDGVGQVASRAAAEFTSADAHKELLHILVTIYGTDGVRQMLDELE